MANTPRKPNVPGPNPLEVDQRFRQIGGAIAELHDRVQALESLIAPSGASRAARASTAIAGLNSGRWHWRDGTGFGQPPIW
jgi:hypothetical protein